MASRKPRNSTDSARDRARLHRQRLKLIKQRHRELILKPRDGLIASLLEDEGPFHDFDEQEELSLVESYELRGRL